MKQNDIRFSIYLKKSEINEEGLCSIMAQLSVGGNSKSSFSATIETSKKPYPELAYSI